MGLYKQAWALFKSAGALSDQLEALGLGQKPDYSKLGTGQFKTLKNKKPDKAAVAAIIADMPKKLREQVADISYIDDDGLVNIVTLDGNTEWYDPSNRSLM